MQNTVIFFTEFSPFSLSIKKTHLLFQYYKKAHATTSTLTNF
jgi:hypothetical protein